jgi:GNAT superfamily N-acetyltransferase
MEVSVRRASSSDAESITALYLRAREAAAATAAIPPPVHADGDVAMWIANSVIPKLDCWLAERSSGELVGMLVLEQDWIDQLYVDPALTGHGIGMELLGVAKRERPDGLRLWTFISNERAQRFYERNGFVELERTDGSRNEEGAPDIQYVWEPP